MAVSAQGSTLTETIAGAFAPSLAAASVRMLASRGQKSRQSGSMKVTIAGRPRSEARLKALPCSSVSVKAGAGRAPAGQVETAESSALAFECLCERATSAPIATPDSRVPRPRSPSVRGTPSGAACVGCGAGGSASHPRRSPYRGYFARRRSRTAHQIPTAATARDRNHDREQLAASSDEEEDDPGDDADPGEERPEERGRARARREVPPLRTAFANCTSTKSSAISAKRK